MKHGVIPAAVLLVALVAAGCAEESPRAEDGVVRTLYVDAVAEDCVGVGPRQCLRVRADPQGEWTLLYDPIVGFAHEPGYAYELLIREERVPNPPADASAIRRTLVQVVSRTRTDAAAGD